MAVHHAPHGGPHKGSHHKAAHKGVHTVKHTTHLKPAGSRKPHHPSNGTTHHKRAVRHH